MPRAPGNVVTRAAQQGLGPRRGDREGGVQARAAGPPRSGERRHGRRAEPRPGVRHTAQPRQRVRG